jgi:amino acid transporter
VSRPLGLRLAVPAVPGTTPNPRDESTAAAPPPEAPTFRQRLTRILMGRPRSVEDPSVFHKVSLVTLLAWVGLGADGLSSSSYGPEEMFRALGSHTSLAVGLAVATAFTVLVIALSYSKIIEHFPFGGGGFIVATRLLGPGAGVISGSALVVDYVLTITTSIAAGTEAVFSLLDPSWGSAKLVVELLVIGLLVLLNLRGVRESVTVLTPIFLSFLLTHAILIFGALGSTLQTSGAVVHEVHASFQHDLTTLGAMGMLALFLRAYSMGAGTYTGIEAVSNGLAIMREPKVATAKRTMALMAASLAITAGGITLCYLFLHVSPEEGRTMNAVLTDRFAGNFTVGGVAVGRGFLWLTLLSEALLLFVAAQAGFIDGPRVMANMSIDSWLPHRFAQLSDRLTMQNGVVLMGLASVGALVYTRGNISTLVTLYAINVFLTFSLSQAAMCRFWLRRRARHDKTWLKGIAVHVIGFVLCAGILVVNLYEKFTHGAWVTVVVTGGLVALCVVIRRHYRTVQKSLLRLDEILPSVSLKVEAPPKPLEPREPTAVLLVGSYAGLGVHCLLTVQRLFPGYYKNFIFISVGVIDSATFKDSDEVREVKERTVHSLQRYVALARGLGLAADMRYAIGTEAVEVATRVCREVGKEFPRSMFFAGKLIFQSEQWYQRVLHNETAYQLQRRLQFLGLNAMVLPVRMLENQSAPA